MHTQKPLGFVTGLKWTVEELNGRPAVRYELSGISSPLTVAYQRQLVARAHEDGMILETETSHMKTRRTSYITQAEADHMRLNSKGEFEIPVIGSRPPHEGQPLFGPES